MIRQIEVDTDVFAAIWSRRDGDEATENEILRRLLLSASTLFDSAVALHNRAAPPKTLEPKEGKTSYTQENKQTDIMESEMGKIRWVDDIRAALGELGGRASLHRIYEVVEQRRREGGRSRPKTLEAVIRRTLEDHSSDSANFRATDLFALVGRGEWALRSLLPKNPLAQ